MIQNHWPQNEHKSIMAIMSTNPRISQALRDKAQAMYVSGDAANMIAQELGLKVNAIRRMAQREGWTRQRHESKSITQVAIAEVVAEGRVKKAIEYVEPILSRLSKRALDTLETEKSLTSKDYIRTLTPLLTLKAKLSGELISPSENQIGYGDFFKLLCDMDSSHLESLKTKYNHEPIKLIE